jgi:mono/diheme cytochrome c family protein
MLRLAVDDPSPAIRLAALSGLGRFDEPAIPDAILASYPEQPEEWRGRARDLLLARPEGARALLNAVALGRIPPEEVTTEQVARVATLGDPGLDAMVREHWGAVAAATPEERLAEVRRLNNDLRAGPGDFGRGQSLFRQHCAACHRLFGEGGGNRPRTDPREPIRS